ncbi:hypothetical protein EOC83_01325 [Mesorhizobium sp. Primo-A]|uniref:DUF5801 repeats-in-toxin domain-containing protein n=1 Tax=unclassified Mesorhizobium TaxID=325217 RepID=UPI000FC99A69|nr:MULTISPECIES: DUF5801 repeats-in-toxin domain-containing protein [unclassified Mesorhizobium]RUU41834.1 hypothetical protein EOC83_01325 [Mesorhizobium sp. Primo-A]RVC11811.1 hypothetical protein ENZ74_12510 [Mesorhizobium sp. M7A.F.Ca.CA.002.15.2.1]
MALDILTQDIVLDETTGFTDDDINPAIPPYDTNPTVQYLLSLDDPGGLTSPEVAFQANFVVASASAGETITSVVLSQNLTGTPFSTTVGVNSGIQTVDGNYVWLFKDADPPHANVVIGVIGTSDPSAAPAATGPLAFSFGLVSTSATNADLYTVEYVPLLNPDATNPDDRIGLTNKVFASVTGTSVASFLGSAAAPGNNDFYLINSANDASKQLLVIGLNGGSANVSEQGFGINNQSINPNETLQVDFVTGGTLNAGSASQIQYGNHIETITQAGFTISQITPSTPTARVDVTVSAFNNTGNDQGTNFFDGTTTSPVDITGIKLTGTSGFASVITVDGTYATGSGNITVTGLSGTGNAVTITGLDNTTTVDITTGSPMDRLTVKGVDANEGCDISEFHFSATSTNAYSEEVGSHINFKDDGPSISTTGAEPTLTVDESVLTTNDTQSFAANFSSGFGADGAGTLTYALGVVAGPSGLIDTATGQAVVLSLNGSVVEGHTIGSNDLVFTVSVSAAGAVTLDQLRAVVHADASNPDDSTSLAADNLVTLTATVTDKDGDHLSASLDIGQNLNFKDDGPSISTTGTEPTLTVDESNLGANSADFATVFTPNAGADSDAISYALGINQVTNVSGLTDTLTGLSVLLFVEGGEVVGRAGSAAGDIVFTVSVAVDGTVTLDQARAVIHSPDTGPDQQTSLAADDLVTLTAIITDGDGDQASDSVNIGTSLVFKDDAPTITVPFDGDQNAGNGIGTPETLANTLNASATGAFGYDIGADAHPAAFYASGSDFVDQNGALAGVQIGLTGTITGGGGGNILTSEVTLASESLTSATFNFTFTYDKDPAAGTQTGTAGGTLVFDKIADTYTIHLTDPLEGFSFDVIHTSQLLSKEPLGNTGHPQIVLEKLQADDPNTPANENFYVQFTGNLINKANPFSLTANGEGSSGDATFTLGGHEMVSNANESWVSATQSTNGVAGDTIQKGELLTLRFFDSNVGINSQNEATQPTATAGTMAIKFDGIGNSEDLMLILNLIDDKGTASTLDDVSITRAMYVQNADIFKMGHVPAPYSGEFTLDNNDGLVIIEQNDYNAAGEHFVLQGVQIMQSGNGITGNNTAINLNPTTGAGGGSDATTNLVNFDPTDNDVLKITDIGFTSTSTQTPDAHLDFAFKVADADADQTAMQHILVDVA